MSTESQLSANRRNSLHSTGPATEEGKQISSRNARTHGLFTLRDYVRPDEQPEYERITTALQSDLNPQGALEETYAMTIVGATWRLRRCSLLESEMSEIFSLDPMEDEAGYRIQRSVDRARGQAFHILRHASAELRRLQTARTVREGVTQLAPNQAASAQLASNCNQLESIARGAPCPCGSGAKFKRCCGKQAAPLLHRVHRAAV